MSEAKIVALYQSWDALVKKKETMGALILEMIAHPEATTQDIERWIPQYRAVVQMLREHRPHVIDALGKGYSWRTQNFKDAVMKVKL